MGDEYPKVLYRKGTAERVWQYDCDTLIVNSAQEEAAAEGWFTTPAEAYGGEVLAAAAPADENGFVRDGDLAGARAAELDEQLTKANSRIAELEAELAEARPQASTAEANHAEAETRAAGLERDLEALRARSAADAQAADDLLKSETEARTVAEAERDEAKAALAKFDHDDDGKPGGRRKGTK